MNQTAPTLTEIITVCALGYLVIFSVQVLVIRWIFRVNKAIGLLEEINTKLDGLAKEPINLDDLIPRK